MSFSNGLPGYRAKEGVSVRSELSRRVRSKLLPYVQASGGTVRQKEDGRDIYNLGRCCHSD